MSKRVTPWGVEELEAVAGAVRRIQEAGCSASLRSGIALWPSHDAAMKGVLTPELVEDATTVARAAQTR